MDLIQFLYVVLHYYISGNTLDKEGGALVDSIHNTSFPIRIPYLGDVITAMKSSKNVNYLDLAQALQDYNSEYLKSPDAHLSFSRMIQAFARYFKSGAAGSYKFLEKNITLCDSSYVRNLVHGEIIDQSSINKQLKATQKKMGYSDHLSQDEEKEAKKSNPELYKEYLALKRKRGQAWKNALSEFVKESGSKTVPYVKATGYLKSKGIEHSMPVGFTGLVDADGAWYSKDGELIQGVPAAVMFPSVIMNKTGTGDWVFQAIRPDGEPGNYFYTASLKRKNSSEKFEFTGNFIKKLPTYRKKWLGNIKKPFDYKSIPALSSLVIELLYLSSQRVGTKVGGNETGSGFGMSSILVKHLTIRENGSCLISYAGKDGVRFKFVLNPGSSVDKVMCEALAHLEQGKKPTDPVFTRELANGSWKALGSGSITAYFRSITGGANIHKLRTAAGTSLFDSICEGYFEKLGDRKIGIPKALELLKSAAVQVGKKLGHVTRDATGATTVSPGTSLKNYIDVNSQIAFFKHFNLPVPVYLEKMLAIDKTITSSLNLPSDAEKDVGLSEEEKKASLVIEKLIVEYLEGNEQMGMG